MVRVLKSLKNLYYTLTLSRLLPPVPLPQRFGLSALADKPEIGKKIALSDYIEKIVTNAKYLVDRKYKKLSIGFSDDDKENIESIKSLIQDELIDLYPEINFVIYDTSEGNKNKLVVKKE